MSFNMKTVVYSWRLAPETKAELERLARRRDRTLARLLDEMAAERLAAARRDDLGDEEEQRRIRARAMRAVGKLGGGARRSEQVRILVRERLGEKLRAGRC